MEKAGNLSDVGAYAELLAAQGRAVDALQLLGSAAAAGNGEAAFKLGLWYLTGAKVPRNLASSRDYFRRAAEAGHRNAEHVYAAFLATGTGGARQWRDALGLLRNLSVRDNGAREQLRLLERMKLTEAGDPAEVAEPQVLSDCPSASLFRQFLTPDECRFLIAVAEPQLQPSTVIDEQTGRHVPHPIRTSEGTGFPLIQENPALHAINRRIAAASKTDPSQGEPLQVLRYRPGQEYRPHSDAVPGTRNQRILTMLIYLNDAYEGGETFFVSSGLAVRGKAGDALLFRNASADGRPDPAAVHAGLPVRRGTKLLASRWIRAAPIDLTKPLSAA